MDIALKVALTASVISAVSMAVVATHSCIQSRHLKQQAEEAKKHRALLVLIEVHRNIDRYFPKAWELVSGEWTIEAEQTKEWPKYVYGVALLFDRVGHAWKHGLIDLASLESYYGRFIRTTWEQLGKDIKEMRRHKILPYFEHLEMLAEAVTKTTTSPSSPAA